MKKGFIYIALLVSTLIFAASCEKQEIGGTSTEALAGEWIVSVVAIDADGEVVFDDPFGNGHFHLDTYNTANDNGSQIWVNDNTNFWEFSVKANASVDNMSFNVTEGQNYTYDSKVTITNGKILLGAATTPSGAAADSIVFKVLFDDDPNPAAYGFVEYRLAGYRYTGLTADN